MVVGRWDEHKPESIDELSQRTANHDNESRRIGKEHRQKIKLKLTGASILSIDAGEEPAFEEADPNLKGKGKLCSAGSMPLGKVSLTSLPSQTYIINNKSGTDKSGSGKNRLSWRMSNLPYFPCEIEECSFVLSRVLFA